MSEWQPIATAPKDGTEVFVVADGKVALGQYDVSVTLKYGREVKRSEGWLIYSDRLIMRKPLPTLWMPLPKDGWLPIESAPKDGTSIIFLHDTRIRTIHYRDEVHLCHGREHHRSVGWWSPTFIGPKFVHPEVWQPIPEPPADAASSLETAA